MTTANGPRAIVIGASGMIGRALADVLDQRGHGPVLRVSRKGPIVIDLASAQSIADAVSLLGPLDSVSHVLIATGLLHEAGNGPEKSMRVLDASWLARQFAVNAIGPALVLARLLPLLPRKLPVRVGVLSARVGSISDNRLGGWYGYRASKAALNQMIRTAAIEWARTHPLGVLIALHPGTIRSDLSDPYIRPGTPAKLGDAQQRAMQMIDLLDQLEPKHSGRIFDYAGKEIMP